MAKKVQVLSGIFLLLIVTFTFTDKAFSQQAADLDSAITLTTRLITERKFEKAEFQIDSLFVIANSREFSTNLLLQLKLRSLQGRFLLQKSQFDQWPGLYEWIQSIDSKCTSEEEISLLVRLFNNAGIAFKRFGLLRDSEEAFLKACAALKRLKEPDYFLYGSVYANAGNSLKQIGEFDRSIEYLEQSISYFDQFLIANQTSSLLPRIADLKGKAMDNLGLVFQAQGNHNKAIQTFNSCIQFKKEFFPGDIALVYSNLIISLIETGQYSEAKVTAEQILQQYEQGKAKDRIWALAKLNQIDLNKRMSKDYKSYHADLSTLIQKILLRTPDALDILTVAFQMQSTDLQNQGKFEDANLRLMNAFNSISNGDQHFDPAEIPYTIKTIHFNKLIELMNQLAQIHYNWGFASNDISRLKKAEQSFQFSLKLIDSLRNSLELQASKLQVSRMQRTTYDQMLDLQYEIHHKTQDSSYIGRMFTTMEQCKSAGLWSSVQDENFKLLKIPQEELEKESSLQKQITDIQGQIIEASALSKNNESLIRDLQRRYLVINQQLDSLKQVFRQSYPEYYNARFDRSTVDIQTVRQNLSQKQLLIQYTITGDNLYILALSKSGVTVQREVLTEKTTSDINFLLEFMKGGPESLTSKARTLYCEAANSLYNTLLEPIGSHSGVGELIIIPDGLLSYVPFETLLSKPLNGVKQDYRTLPYLIRLLPISYGLTASLYFHTTPSSSLPVKRILAVAPSYRFTNRHISDYVKNAQQSLPELSGTYEESRAIYKMVGGKLLDGNRASESTFKEVAGRYSILHLAMHSIPDNANSLNSGLVFTPGADHEEDGVLFGHEVYNLSLHARLTVLSACETGSGQLAGGEGILSFGRAFIAAGSPNLIMTLWTVDDQSSKEIVVGFYKALLKGEGIANSLQFSKLGYIEIADQLHAHPHYWAGFIDLGQNQSISIPPRRPGVLFLVIFVLVTVSGILVIQAKRNPRRSGDIVETNKYRSKSETGTI